MMAACVHQSPHSSPATNEVAKEQNVLKAVESLLWNSAYLEMRRVHCTFHEGVLTLVGRVSSYYRRQVAQVIVQGLEGIEAIENHLEVSRGRSRQSALGRT
jgi:osmotically-inducible protein OsmY